LYSEGSKIISIRQIIPVRWSIKNMQYKLNNKDAIMAERSEKGSTMTRITKMKT
jgi:hypothetical protein